MLTEPEFKAKIRINHRPRLIGKKQHGVTVTGYYDPHGCHADSNKEMSEEWHVESPTDNALAHAEHQVRELLWRAYRRNQIVTEIPTEKLLPNDAEISDFIRRKQLE